MYLLADPCRPTDALRKQPQKPVAVQQNRLCTTGGLLLAHRPVNSTHLSLKRQCAPFLWQQLGMLDLASRQASHLQLATDA